MIALITIYLYTNFRGKIMYTDKQQVAIDNLQVLARQLNKSPTANEYRLSRLKPSVTTVNTLFGSWNLALKAANLDTYSNTVTTEYLIEKLLSFKNTYGKAPVQRDFEKNTEYPSSATYQRRFGSWKKALIAAGLATNYVGAKKVYSEESIILAIKHFYSLNNRNPRTTDFSDNNDYPSFSTVVRHFGTWYSALEAAGLSIDTQAFGIRTLAADNHLYRSHAEAYFVDNYLHDKYEYIIEPKYPKPYTYVYDWYIPSIDLYIELDGGIRPERTKEKRHANILLGRKCLFLSTKSMYKNLENDLLLLYQKDYKL